jgi:3-hydroxyacyl-[acyl-carrier-protein] dehydratase
MTALDAVALQEVLPHRHPFLLVDRIEIIEAGRRVRGFKRITANEWWMEGMADAPAGTAVPPMPHSLVLEALAQTSGALVRDLLDGTDRALAYFMGANRVRYRRAARVGDELTLDVALLNWRRGICRTRCTASAGGETVVSGDLTTVVRAS